MTKKGLSKYKTEQESRILSSALVRVFRFISVFVWFCTTVFGIQLWIGNTECQVHILGQWEDQTTHIKFIRCKINLSISSYFEPFGAGFWCLSETHRCTWVWLIDSVLVELPTRWSEFLTALRRIFRQNHQHQDWKTLINQPYFHLFTMWAV